jgi:hypothetical protein
MSEPVPLFFGTEQVYYVTSQYHFIIKQSSDNEVLETELKADGRAHGPDSRDHSIQIDSPVQKSW